MAISESQKKARDSIAEVVELGLEELGANRRENAKGQFELAARMCAPPKGEYVESAPLNGAQQRDPRYSSSLEMGLRVFSCFTVDRPIWGIVDIAQELGIARGTAHRYCATLVRLGQITQDGVGARKYRRV